MTVRSFVHPSRGDVGCLQHTQRYVYTCKKYKHSNSQGKYAECIAPISRLTINAIKEGENVNKIIAECCFDIFVGSPSHMKILLKEDKRYEYGFGVTITDDRIFVVVQAQKTP